MYPKLDSQKHPSILFVISIVSVTILGKCHSQPVPAIFAFGDSLNDAGNNNYIMTLAKADYMPNGIDFGRPTGRFTNGKSTVDIIGKELGFQNYTPPFLAPTTNGAVVLKGVNYASGGSGILSVTGAIFGGHICMDKQLDNFAKTRQDIISNVGASAALRLLEKSLFYITVGSNDFLINYLNPLSKAADQNMIGAKLFIRTVIANYKTQLTRLYNLGARKIVVVNLGPLGCMPYARDLYGVRGDNCVEFANQVAQSYNSQLKSLVDELNSKLAGSKFVHANVYNMVEDVIQNYTSYGFENANSACCYSAGRFGGLLFCNPASIVCKDRSRYVFWDPFHPTEALYATVAKRFLHGGPPDISPINIWQLVKS